MKGTNEGRNRSMMMNVGRAIKIIFIFIWPPNTLSFTHTHTHTLTLSLSFSITHTDTQTHTILYISLSLTHAHTHTHSCIHRQHDGLPATPKMPYGLYEILGSTKSHHFIIFIFTQFSLYSYFCHSDSEWFLERPGEINLIF